MLNRKLLALLLLVLLTLTACGPAVIVSPTPVASAPQPLPTQGDTWSITLTQSGGIAGIMRTIQVTSNGQATATDQRSGKTVTQTLTAEKTSALSRFILNLQVASSATPEPVCMDCFIYTIEVEYNGRPTKVQLDDMNLADSGMQDLVSYLVKLRDGMLMLQ